MSKLFHVEIIKDVFRFPLLKSSVFLINISEKNKRAEEYYVSVSKEDGCELLIRVISLPLCFAF